MFLFIILILVLVFIIAQCRSMNLSFKFKTFKEKGAKADSGKFGVYSYNGAQGRGKTYSLTEFVYDNKNLVIYSNFHFTDVINTHFENELNYYDNGFESLMKIKNDLDSGLIKIPVDKQLVIIYDELFQELMRGDKLSKEVLDFLSQMRKRKIIFLTSAQYWSEIPISFRRFVRYQIDCSFFNIPFLPFSILLKTFHDGDLIKWDNDSQDFVAPIIETSISKVRKNVFKSYDTFELIRLQKSPHPAFLNGGNKNVEK